MLMAQHATRIELTRPLLLSWYSSLHDTKSFSDFNCTICLVPFRSQKMPFAGRNNWFASSVAFKCCFNAERGQSSLKSFRRKDVLESFGAPCLLLSTANTKISILPFSMGLRIEVKRGDRRGVIGGKPLHSAKTEKKECPNWKIKYIQYKYTWSIK